ncbi:GTPase [Methylomarinum vadi]|uniref:GTPase n=1 Tax=Methylomarinum vadi TaxID=438855 RepID=UPI0004DF5B46|nr:GTPase domain-containing protein [Methylomarinum vadi]
MLEFIQILKQRYQAVIGQMNEREPLLTEYQQRVEQLIYAEAFIRKGQIQEARKHFPLQIAVIGPTQAGKSSVVNLLLGDEIAGVSPLAGYTVHPHGFCHNTAIDDCVGLQNYFGRFQQLAEQQLSNSRYDCYSLAHTAASSALLPDCVLWDTPDFDSIDSADYKEGVIRTIALADIVVLVVSKEKYADQSVWEIMATIESFHQPTLICLNKLIEGSEQFIVPSLKEKWLQVRRDAFPDVVPLFFNKQTGAPLWPESAGAMFSGLVKKVAPTKHALYQQQLLSKYWQSWLEPVYAERQASENWRAMVDRSLANAVKEYQRDYLDHPHHYLTFQTALLELLNLLEIPGIAKVLSKTRRVMTWPVRKLIELGKNRSLDGVSQEVSLLQQIGEHVIIQLADRLLQKAETETGDHGWWRDACNILRKRKQLILQEYETEVRHYHANFQQDVEATAHRLYNKLLEQPMTLNALRATRITTDATAMALAIKTGGIGVHDLLLTPAMLSVTSLLAESAIGSYMNKLEAELKQHQLETVTALLFEDTLKQALYRLPEHLAGHKRFNISPEQLQQAEQYLKEKKHGLRIL